MKADKTSPNLTDANAPVIIALDAMGGDYGPDAVVPGAALALKKLKNTEFVFFGREDAIRARLKDYPTLEKKSRIEHTDDVISGDARPSVALRTGKKSSMRLAIDCVASGQAHSVVSAGNTGALMATAKLVLRPLSGIHRPAIASTMPSLSGSVLMLDLGANLTCDAENLVQFAILGCVYARVVMGVERPSVGLLNIGSEDVKGHDHLRDALSILNSIPFQGDFKGFVEGDDIGKGSVDVVVTDGFTGNVALKTAEGFGSLFSSTLKQEFSRSIFSKLAYFLALRPFNAVRRRLDHRVYNGGLFLGLNGVCIKSHGSADDVAFSHAVITAHKMAANNFNPVVAREIEMLASEETFLAVTNERASI